MEEQRDSLQPEMSRTAVYRPNLFTIEPIDIHGREGRLVVRFGNGKRLQITTKVRDLLSEIDGRASCEEIAERLSRRWGVATSPQDVQGLIERMLLPYQLAVPDGSPPAPIQSAKTRAQKWRDKLLLQDFFFKFPLVRSERVASITAYTRFLFARQIAVAVLACCAVVNGLVYQEVVTLRAASRLGLTDPVDYALVLLLVFASVLFHEIGHATALARYDQVPDHIGFGLYFLYPAFYANVNESWRLTRGQRVVVDLAGIYFQIIAILGFYAGYVATHKIYLLYAILFSESLAVYSLIPFFKFDGYWCLADIVGVPNFRKRAMLYLGHTLRRLVTRKETALPYYLSVSRGVGAVLFLYAASSLVFFGFVIVSLVRVAPGMFLAYPNHVSTAMSLLSQSYSAGLFAQAGIVLIRLALRTFSLVGICLILLSLGISLQDTARRLARQRRT